MDDLWRREGLEMQMMLYDCISTGYERGLLQVRCRCLSYVLLCFILVTIKVVLNATTLGHVLLDATKKQNTGAGAFKRKIGSALKALVDYDVLREWIYEQVRYSSTALLGLDKLRLFTLFRCVRTSLTRMKPEGKLKWRGNHCTCRGAGS